MKNFALLLLIVGVCGCSSDNVDVNPSESQLPLIHEPNMRVNSYTVDCVGELAGKCLLVQEGDKIGTQEWSYFYFEDSIEGFEFEPGYIYDIAVQKTRVNNPPMDMPATKYELLEVISKIEV